MTFNTCLDNYLLWDIAPGAAYEIAEHLSDSDEYIANPINPELRSDMTDECFA